MDLHREKDASTAYLNLLRKKGCEEQLLKQREVFLVSLCAYLKDKPLTGGDYREAVEALMETRPAESWPSDLITAQGSLSSDVNTLVTDPASVDPAQSEGKTSADLDGHLKKIASEKEKY